ncbi:MAG: hypothetical protein R3296_03455 [Oleiphilaceae bacterium]|nr:hypothetical protein [Oleiphilaceae bacterium]
MPRGVMLVALAALLTACSNRLYPPVPDQPVTLYLMDHGRHASLILPHEDNGWVRYAHGEWRWYARLEQGYWRGAQALFWPTRATIGRQRLQQVPTRPGVHATIPEGFRQRIELVAEAQRVRVLRERLDGHFAEPSQRVFQPVFNLEFVPYPRSYWFGRNSNRTMADWLEALGVRVSGPALFSHWQPVTESGPGD